MSTIMTNLSNVFKPLVTSIANDIKSMETTINTLKQELDKANGEHSETGSSSNNTPVNRKATAKEYVGLFTNISANKSEDMHLVFTRIGNVVSTHIECPLTATDSEKPSSPSLFFGSNNDGVLIDHIPVGFRAAAPATGVILTGVPGGNVPIVRVEGSKIFIPWYDGSNGDDNIIDISLTYLTDDEFPAE